MLISLLIASMSNPPSPYAASLNQFGMSIFQDLAAGNKGGNILVSPLSIGTAMAMVAEGSEGATWTGMEKAMGLQSLGRDGMTSGASALKDALGSADPNTRMEIANILWANQSYRFESSYAQGLQANYGAEARTLDFSSPSTIPTMNKWVEERTHGKIKEIVSDLPPGSLMVIMNAISFKGDWVFPFDPEANTKLPWNGKGTAEYMRRRRNWDYLEAENLQFVRLPYGNSRFSMEIALPKDGQDINHFTADLTAAKWKDWSLAAKTEMGMVMLPKWTGEYAIELSGILKKMGMADAFSSKANFSRMIKSPPGHIDLVNHKTFIRVDEKGTEAAAVTSTQLRAGSRPPDKQFSFLAERPFVYAITEAESGAILFLGVVRNPN